MKLGNAIITQEKSAKLLGITFNDKQDWKTHVEGPGGVITSLNRRLFSLKRLRNHIDKKSMLKVSNGLFNSKITIKTDGSH